MQDYLGLLEKLRRDSYECRMLGNQASDQSKRDFFSSIADHLAVLADQVELALLDRKAWQKQANARNETEVFIGKNWKRGRTS